MTEEKFKYYDLMIKHLNLECIDVVSIFLNVWLLIVSLWNLCHAFALIFIWDNWFDLCCLSSYTDISLFSPMVSRSKTTEKGNISTSDLQIQLKCVLNNL